MRPTVHVALIKTSRLNLEPIDETHAKELCEFFSDPLLHTFVPFEPPTFEQQLERCKRWAQRQSPDGSEIWLNWAARDLKTNLIMGHFQSGVKQDGSASIGYVVARDFQGKGHATEAIKLILNLLRENFNVKTVKAWTDSRNIASHKLAQKVGMTHVETIKDADFFKGATSDEFVFAMELS